MALVDLTKQLAKEAFLSATREPVPAPAPAPAQADSVSIGSLIAGQIGAMQKALKEDEELVVWFQNGGERIRVIEFIMPSWRLAILSGLDSDRNLTRVISGVESLQLVAKVMKLQPGVKPTRVGLVTPRSKDSSG